MAQDGCLLAQPHLLVGGLDDSLHDRMHWIARHKWQSMSAILASGGLNKVAVVAAGRW